MNGKIIALLVGLAVLAAVGLNLRSAGSADMAVAPIDLEINDMSELADRAPGIHVGDENAPITILEFADFQCPGCMAFAGTVKPQVDVAFVESGAVKFVFYDFPLTSIHPHAFLAARAGRCADEQGAFWEYHDEIFRNQSAWSFSAAPPSGAFEDYAAQVGLDQGDFRSCLRSDRYADVVTANMQLGQGLGVTGTPTILITRGGRDVRRVDAGTIADMYPEIQRIVQELQAEIEAESGAAAEGGS
ncbi:MAG: DsbA family protein [Gemmatimonadetes bacterium]|nr:DsbA family protein [Gemmatimonadota bacterium]NNF39513.1 DsbA family protein [Gemmatimonadota bacterium]NNK62312.1 DsbA family protein [Gemmatimonadota bacterium]